MPNYKRDPYGHCSGPKNNPNMYSSSCFNYDKDPFLHSWLPRGTAGVSGVLAAQG